MQATVIRRQLRARPQYRGVVMAEVDISYPQVITKGSPAGAAISGFYSAAASSYYSYATGDFCSAAVKDYISGRKSNIPFRPYTANKTFEVPYNQNGFLSIYSDIYEFTGGAHGNTERQADTWSLTDGRRMELDDFFTGYAYRNIILNSIAAQIGAQISAGSGVYFDGYLKNVFRYYDEKHYHLTPNGFAMFFPLYTIAPYSSGIVTFVIPYSEFGGLLRYPF